MKIMNRGWYEDRRYHEQLDLIEGSHITLLSEDLLMALAWAILANNDGISFFRFVRITGFQNHFPLLYKIASLSCVDAISFAWFVDTYKIDVNDTTAGYMGKTALWYCDTVEKARVLLERGANVHAQNWEREQVVRFRASVNQMHHVMLLLEYGAWIKAAEYGIKHWHASHFYSTVFELDKKLAEIGVFRVREAACKAAIYALTYALRRLHRFICKDVRVFIAQHIWRTRRNKIWTDSP